jgi:TP901-1 family phage major tail protein
MPNGYKGASATLWIYNAGAWVQIAALKSSSWSISNETIDVTTKDNVWFRTLLDGGVRAIEIAASGIWVNSTISQSVEADIQNGVARRFQYRNPDGTVITGLGQCTKYERSGNNDGAEEWSYSLSLMGITDELGIPTITSAATASGTAGQAFSYQITATGTPTSYAAAGLPAGLSINTTTGLISGTPSGSGVSSISITATNGSGTSPTFTLTLTVTAAVLGYVALNGSANGDLPYYISSSGLVQLNSTQWPSPVVGGQTVSQDAVFWKRSADSKIGTFVGSAFASAGLYAAKSDTTYLAGYGLIATDTSILQLEGDAVPITAGTYRFNFDGACFKLTTSGGPPIPTALTISTDGGDTFGAVGGTVTGMSYSGGVIFFEYEVGLVVYGTTDSGGGGNSLRYSLNSGATISAMTSPGAVIGGFSYNSANSTICCSASTYSGSYSNDTVFTSASGTISWTSRQTFVSVPTARSDKGLMSAVDFYIYYPVKLTTGGWTMYRTPKDITTFTAWAINTVYTAGQARTNGGNIYICTTGGTSAGAGGPTGTGSSIADNTVTWAYHGPSTAMFQQVHQPGGTAARPSKVRKLSDNNLYYLYNQQLYRSTDGGATFAALGSAVTKTANQIAVV